MTAGSRELEGDALLSLAQIADALDVLATEARLRMARQEIADEYAHVRWVIAQYGEIPDARLSADQVEAFRRARARALVIEQEYPGAVHDFWRGVTP